MTEEEKTPDDEIVEAPDAEPQAPAAADTEAVEETAPAAAADDAPAEESAAEREPAPATPEPVDPAEEPASSDQPAGETEPAAKKTAAKKTAAKKTAAKKAAPKADAEAPAEDAPAEEAPAEEAPAEPAAEEAAGETTAEAPKKPRRRTKRTEEPPAEEAKPAPRKPRAPGEQPIVRAQARYVRTSARKARLVCDHIRGKSVEEARAILAHTPRSVAEDWQKLLESAVANAENNNALDADELKIHKVFADEGPTLKRFRPRAMGRATRIRKRTSHLTIQLTTKE